MFLHIATDIKDMDTIKRLFENSTNLTMDDYEKEIHNISDILLSQPKDKEQSLSKMYKSLLFGRKDNILVIILYDHIEDINEIDKNKIISSNCLILENDNCLSKRS